MNKRSPDYYNNKGIQPFDVMERVLSPEELRGFFKGNIIKYAMRCGKKCVSHPMDNIFNIHEIDVNMTAIDDLDKIIVYCKKLQTMYTSMIDEIMNKVRKGEYKDDDE